MATIDDLDVSPSTLLRGMRGEIVRAGLAYPEVLHVEVRDLQGALWRFSTQDADWFPEDPGALRGMSVDGAVIGSTGELAFSLSDGSTLRVMPGRMEAHDDPPNWELLTPDGLSLEFGPGLRWQVSSSDDI
ncbi:MAG: hypothetical protein WKF94_13005 [Solirubrobacteraceae bacterium]